VFLHIDEAVGSAGADTPAAGGGDGEGGYSEDREGVHRAWRKNSGLCASAALDGNTFLRA